MARFTRLLRLLRRESVPAPDADAVLLERFALHQDQAAFADLVQRHGPLVRRVCRRALADPAAADDVFQATFLVLARRAGSIQRPQLLAGWLHGVACRLARKAAGSAARGPRQWSADAPEPADPHPDPLAELSARDLLEAIDEEVARLPENHRLPVLLCCLEGLSLEEAAARLGWSRGSVKGRLERGRAKLHARLTHRGLALPAALAAVELSRQAAAAIPVELAEATARAAALFAAFQPAGVAEHIVALTQEVLKSMSLTRMKTALLALLALCGTLAAAGLMTQPRRQAPIPEGPRASAQRQRPPERKPEQQEKTRELPVAGEGIVQVTALAFARGGKALLTAGIQSEDAAEGGVVVSWDAATGQRLAAPLKLPEGYRAAEFSPDGKRAIAIKGLGESVRLVDLASGKEVKFGQHVMNHVGRFSPDGKAVVTCSAGASSRQVISELKVWDAATGKLRFAKDGSGKSTEKAYYSADFSPDSKWLLVTRGDPLRAVELLDAENGKELVRLGGAGAGLPRAVFSPDGKRAAAWSSETRETALFDVAKRTAATLKGHTGFVRAAAFTPDSKALVTAALDGTARVWDLKAGEVRATLPLAAPHQQLTLDPGGRLLVALGTFPRPVAQVWDLSSGKEAATLERATQVRFSPDGKTLAVAAGGSRWDVGGGFGFGPGKRGEKKKETPDKVMLVPVAEILKGQE